jgi:hypothetical protein
MLQDLGERLRRARRCPMAPLSPAEKPLSEEVVLNTGELYDGLEVLLLVEGAFELEEEDDKAGVWDVDEMVESVEDVGIVEDPVAVEGVEIVEGVVVVDGEVVVGLEIGDEFAAGAVVGHGPVVSVMLN